MRIGITHGLRGYFAVLYDSDGPIQSGIGSFKKPEDARPEAQTWAMSEWGDQWMHHADREVLDEESKH